MKKQRKLNPLELHTFCSHCAMLISSGMTPLDTMEILMQDAQSSAGGEIYHSIYEECKKGVSFCDAMEASTVFPQDCLKLIRLGEESGNLDTCLQSLADYYEKNENIRNEIRSAVSYPLLMIFLMFFIIYILMSRVLPIFREVFSALGSEMSAVAFSLLLMGEKLGNSSGIFLGILIAFFFFRIAYHQIAPLRSLLRKLANLFPPIRRLSRSLSCQRFASGMAMTLSSGIDIFRSLELVSGLTEDPVMLRKISFCQKELRNGETLSEAFLKSGIFDNYHSRMASIGFRSGKIDTVMKQIADSYEAQTDRKIQGILSVLEPSLVIILSVIVGMILLSVILPLMGVMTNLG